MIPALCCVCGTVREVSRQAFTISGNRQLKCATCGTMTMHALVFGPSSWADWRETANERRENRDDAYDRAGSQPPLPAVP